MLYLEVINWLKIIFRKESIIDLKPADFTSFKSSAGPVNPLLLSTDFKGTSNQFIATIDEDSLDLEIADFLTHITGTVSIANPSIKLNYSNSFPYPVEVDFNGLGIRGDKPVDLNLAPFQLQYPVPPTTTDVTASFTINKTNSSLPDLMSMPPEKIYFSGSVKVTTGSTVILPSNSRLTGSLEVEVPLEFNINNLKVSETIDNFLSSDDPESDDFSASEMDYTRLDITVQNGFPLGLTLELSLYDSVAKDTLKSVKAPEFLKPAPVDANGIVTAKAGRCYKFRNLKRVF